MQGTPTHPCYSAAEGLYDHEIGVGIAGCTTTPLRNLAAGSEVSRRWTSDQSKLLGELLSFIAGKGLNEAVQHQRRTTLTGQEPTRRVRSWVAWDMHEVYVAKFRQIAVDLDLFCASARRVEIRTRILNSTVVQPRQAR